MSTFWIVMIITIVIIGGLAVALYFVGKRAKKSQEESAAAIEANKQTVSMLIIDKKKMKLKDSGLPKDVIAQTPKLMRGTKVSIVKVKVGPQVMNLIADDKIFDSIPVKKEVKAVVSGIYITEVRGYRANKTSAPDKKQGFWKSAWEKAKVKAGVTQVK